MGWLDRFRPQPRGLAAAAVSSRRGQFDSDELRRADRRSSEAWDIYRLVGEVHYATQQQARLVGRLNWFMSINGSDPNADLTDQIFRAAFGSPAEIRDLQVKAAIHLQVPGGYLLARVGGPGGKWEVLANPPDTKTKKKLDRSDIVVKVENQDPRDPESRLDSPVLAALDIARELLLARGQARAMARSRTAQLNTLIYPLEGAGGDPNQFEQDLIDVMVAPLADEMSTSAVVPNLIGFPAEYIENIKTLDLTGPLDEKIHERIDRLIRQLAVVLDIPIEALLGMGDTNHWCRPVGTLAYTRGGWAVPEVGEDILTTEGWRTVRSLYVGDATGDPGIRVTVGNEHGGPHSYTIDATLGHSFYVERAGERLLTKDPRPGDIIFRGLDQRAEAAQTAIYADAFAELLAWYSSDGTLTGTELKPGQIRIAKRDNWPHIDRVLTELWGSAQETMPRGADKPMWRHEVRGDGLHLAVLNKHARDEVLRVVPTKDKAIPLSFVRSLTASQLSKFLTAWDLSDGDGRGGIAQRNPARLSAPEYAAIILGQGVHRFETVSEGFTPGPMHNFYRTSQNLRIRSVEDITLDTEVWCPSTEAGTWLALDPASGWSDYTGNTAWLISEDNWLSHVEPMASPIGEGFAQALERALDNDTNVEITPDPSQLLRRRPTIENALQATQMGLTNEEWALEQIGASPEDAGPGLEAMLTARAARPSSPAVAEPAEPAVAAAPTEPVAIESSPPPAAPSSIDVERLANLDVESAEAMQDLIADAGDRALERLGARLRSIAQGGKIELPDVPNQQVAIAYRQDIPNQDENVADTARKFEPQFERFVSRAFRRIKLAGLALDPHPSEVNDAFAAFQAEVAKVVAARRNGAPGKAEAWLGAKRVMALLGGNPDPQVQPIVSASGVQTSPRGIALGIRALEIMNADYGLVADTWIWHHAYSGPNPHPKHQELAGREIRPGGTVLDDMINWYPGDHAGCLCLVVPVLRRNR